MTKKETSETTSVTIRLNRYLSMCGLGSRRKCDDFISSGHIVCNGTRVTTLGLQVTPDVDIIEYKGRHVTRMKTREYYAYYKPREIMVTAHDPQGRATLYDNLRGTLPEVSHLRYTGRLDYQSEGLLLLTNDGELIHALTHPRFKIKKVYHVKAERMLDSAEVRHLIDGVESQGQLLRAGAVKQLSAIEADRKQYWYEIELFEGKNRQIRRMFEELNILVGRIRRVQFGSVQLGTLKPGGIRPLTERELGAMRNAGHKVPTKNTSHTRKKRPPAKGEKNPGNKEYRR